MSELPTREESRTRSRPDLANTTARWYDAVMSAYETSILKTEAEWLAGLDYQAAINHLEYLRGFRIGQGGMAEVISAAVDGEWGSVDE